MAHRYPYHVEAKSPDGSEMVKITLGLPKYDTISALNPDDIIQDNIAGLANRADCSNTRIASYSLPNVEIYEMEHIFDGVLVGHFIGDAAAGKLRSGTVGPVEPVSISFLDTALTVPPTNPPPLPGGANPAMLYDRVMECLGSNTNKDNFVIALEELNNMKSKLMQRHEFIAKSHWPQWAKDPGRATEVLHRIRLAIAVVRYLDHRGTPNVNQRLSNIVNDIHRQWQFAQNEWNRAHPNDEVHIAEFWRAWIRDFYRDVIEHPREKAMEYIS